MSVRTDKWAYQGPAKHHDKIAKALEKRIAGVPTGKSGFNKPGSMNKKKTGYPKTSGR